MYSKKDFLTYSLNTLFYFIPISFIIGSLVVNLNIILFSILGFIYLYLNKIKIRFNSANICLLIFFLVCVISSFVNIDIIGDQNFYKSIFLFKFFFLYILIEALFLNKKINLKYFFYLCYILIIFVSLDLALQFFYGKNILGYEPWEGRITGIFEHEAIAGSYVQKIFIFSLIAIFLLFFKSEKNKNLPIVFSLTIIIFASFIASNRMSFLILISLIVFLILFFKTFRKSLIISLVLLLPFFYYFYQTDSQVNHRYTQLVIKANKIINLDKFKNNSEQNFDISNSEIKTSKNLPNHSKIFNTSYKSFKDNFLIGNGVKSFRYNCKNYLNQKDTLCSTHPHNYHLEILHDTGLIGFSVLFIFTCLILWKSFRLFQDKRLSYKQKIILALIIANFLIEIFPLKSTGSIFTTWNGTLVWLSVALVNYGNHERYNKKF